ncbi:hypothetical protein ACIBI9_55270 [Nonomuraea sp. NPDC050451]|uniref:hypothetical protein n=1 Tax=Nonomuraea sp. NPDC050451 TaxID=3364364 RepID=UPI003798A1C3
MRFPIDTSQLGFTVASPPSPAKDFATKKVKVTEDGLPVMVVRLLAMDGSDSTMIKFNLAGEQHHLVPGLPVRVEGLAYGTAKDGDVRWWSATGVVPLNGSAGHVAAAPHGSPAAGEQGATAGARGRNPIGAARHSSASAGEPGGEG